KPSGRSLHGELCTDKLAGADAASGLTGICAMGWPAVAVVGLLGFGLFADTPVHAQVRRVATQSGPILVETVATGLVRAWGMASLPDGRLLVTRETAGQRRPRIGTP